MGHTWPWSDNEGFSASEDIWRFVSQFNLFEKYSKLKIYIFY